MKKLIYILLLLFPICALAEPEEPLYQVECIIFKFANNNLSLWQITPKVTFTNTLELEQFTENEIPMAYQLLPEASFRLSKEEKQLRRNSQYQVLLHQAWLQPITDSEHSQPIHIRGGMTYTLPEFIIEEIDGCITITQNTYFSIKTNLFLTEPTHEPTLPEYLSFHMQQMRRTRANELNYIDSPQLGILLKVIPTEMTLAELPPPETNPEPGQAESTEHDQSEINRSLYESSSGTQQTSELSNRVR